MGNIECEFPAHYREEDGKYQTVKKHLANVSRMCGIYGEVLGFKHFCELAGWLHDMGKFTDEFYNYFMKSVEEQKRGEYKAVLKNETVDHGRHGAVLIWDRYHNGNDNRKVTAEILSMIICYHHGGLQDFISLNLDTKMLTRIKDKDSAYEQALERFLECVCSYEKLDSLFEEAIQELKDFNNKQEKVRKAFSLQLLTKYLYSCLIDADRYDTYLFMEEQSEKEFDRNQLWELFSDRLAVQEEKFKNQKTGSVMREQIRSLRQIVWQECKESAKWQSGIYTLTAATGSGKTFSSLRFAIDHAQINGKKRILYVLPFTTIIEQNAKQVREALQAGDNLLEHHSNVIVEDKSCLKKDLKEQSLEIRETDDEFGSKYRLLTEQWDSPIIFTTMVQFLNTFFASGTQSIRRFHNLTDAIIIFDEVQALPVKCISLFNESINFLCRECRDTIILCSATQPSLESLQRHSIQIDGEMIQDVLGKFHAFKRMNVIDFRKNGKMTITELGGLAGKQILENQSVLIIVNTRNLARDIYEELRSRNMDEDSILYFLSTNLCPEHRGDTIDDMKAALEGGKKVICVSTQLIEAGVDISFECVIRHLAGLDSIAQACGRGNRNGEHAIKNTYIIELEEEKLGSLKVIELGEKHTREVLNEFRKNNEKFDGELLSPSAIKKYFDSYYADEDIEKQMDYPVKELKTSIFKMLSNSGNKMAYQNKYGRESCQLSLDFAFRTAARHFRVIDEYSQSILVPYKKGKELIAGVLGKNGIKERSQIMQKIRHFCVNISNSDFDKLANNRGIVTDLSGEILILKEGFYDEKLGLVKDGNAKQNFCGY